MFLKKHWEWTVLGVLLFLFFAAFTTISLHRYWQYAAWYYDFGIFYSALGKAAQGLTPTIDHEVFSGKHILGDHFHPLIFILVPFVALYNSGETLLVMQVLFVTLSGIFIYLSAKEITKSKVHSLFFVTIYLFFVGLHNALITEFHEIVLLPLPLSIFFYGMVSKKKWAYFLGLAGVLLTKETTFIIPAWFGLLLFFQKDAQWKKIGLMTSFASVLYFLTVVYVMIPAIGAMPYYYFPQSGGTTFEIDALSAKAIFNSFASFGFLPLLSPTTLMPVLFNWYSRIQRFGNFDLGMHYNAELAPTLLLAATYGWVRFEILIKSKFEKLSKKFFNIVLAGITVLVMVFSLQVLKSPLLLLSNQAFFQHTQNFEFLDNLIAKIPEKGVIMAQTNIAAKIANRDTYFLRDNYQEFNPDYIVLDLRDGQEPNNYLGIEDFDSLVARIATDTAYTVYYEQGEQVIYIKK